MQSAVERRQALPRPPSSNGASSGASSGAACESSARCSASAPRLHRSMQEKRGRRPRAQGSRKRAHAARRRRPAAYGQGAAHLPRRLLCPPGAQRSQLVQQRSHLLVLPALAPGALALRSTAQHSTHGLAHGSASTGAFSSTSSNWGVPSSFSAWQPPPCSPPFAPMHQAHGSWLMRCTLPAHPPGAAPGHRPRPPPPQGPCNRCPRCHRPGRAARARSRARRSAGAAAQARGNG